jgi:hypothetical protein
VPLFPVLSARKISLMRVAAQGRIA